MLPLAGICRKFYSSHRVRPKYTIADLISLQEKWESECVLSAELYKNSCPTTTKSKYILSMMPYPSGTLHMGHLRVYSISDTLSRFYRMHGHPVLHPMGWDAFGLPAENAALQNNQCPEKWTYANIELMRRQLRDLGCMFDWDRPDYYKWTQWIFLALYKAGLAYKANSLVNWDSIDKTVLADEQVDGQGRSWRSGAIVEKRKLSQWFLGITRYTKKLLDGLEGELSEWPDAVKTMQRNWIIKKSHVNVNLKLCDGSGFVNVKALDFSDFDYKNVYIASDVRELWEKSAEHPNCPGIEIPIKMWPIDQKELLMAQANCLIVDRKGGKLKPAQKLKGPIEFGERIIDEFRMRDWLISRQRLWGTPIPIIYCEACGIVPVPEKDLPVIRAKPSQSLDEWRIVDCPKCLKSAHRETDTMDTFMDSSWYFLRFLDPQNEKVPCDPVKIRKEMSVDLYVGGIEHAILHLLYARFINRFLMDELGVEGRDEPFKALICQGLVEGLTLKSPSTGKYFSADTVTFTDGKYFDDQEELIVEWDKMSKSKFNGVNPCSLVPIHGSDTVRLTMLFKAPVDIPLRWNDKDIAGPKRWLVRCLNLADLVKDEKEDAHLDGIPNAFLELERAIDGHYRGHRLNVVVASLMKYSNMIDQIHCKGLKYKLVHRLSNMMHPVAPQTSLEIKNILKQSKTFSWPATPTVGEAIAF